MHPFSFTWIALFSIHLLEMTRQLPPGTAASHSCLPSRNFYLSLLTIWLDGHTSAVILKDDRCHVVSSSMSLPFCEHPVCRTVAVDNVFFFPHRITAAPFYCRVIVVLWVAFMEQLHWSWFSRGRSGLISALKRNPVEGNQQPPHPLEEALRWAHVASSIKALLFMLMLIQPSYRHVPIN